MLSYVLAALKSDKVKETKFVEAFKESVKIFSNQHFFRKSINFSNTILHSFRSLPHQNDRSKLILLNYNVNS